MKNIKKVWKPLLQLLIQFLLFSYIKIKLLEFIHKRFSVVYRVLKAYVTNFERGDSMAHNMQKSPMTNNVIYEQRQKSNEMYKMPPPLHFTAA